ncbi:MAG: dienelactone hydrolase family protein [Proteobacteria bacterium]|nr:dienelactone hydrolase family protein [Pseudomonadota bacterium]
MCDDLTTADTEARTGLSRRELAALGGATMAGMLVAQEAIAAGPALSEGLVSVPATDGAIDAFFVHPARGRHPAVIMWPDIAGLREAYRAMARRLAGMGYAVIVPNQYYRSTKAPVAEKLAEWFQPATQKRLAPMIARIDGAGVARDAMALVKWLDAQPAVDRKRGVGTCGYCMTGPFTFRTAAAMPGRVKAAASFHGGGLVTDKGDSPHRMLGQARAAFLVAIARNDDARAPGEKDVLKKTFAADHLAAEVEVYPADHGWCTLDAPMYDKAQAEKAWGRLLKLLGHL